MSEPGRSPRSRQWGIGAVCGLLIAVAVVLNQSAVHWRDNVVDSHLFAYYGWCVAQGARPYLDIWDNKPPLIWWINAAGFDLCGEGVGGEILISTVALTAALAAFVGIARRAYHPSVTVLAAITGCILLPHLVYEGGANRTETFVMAGELLAVLGYLSWRQSGRLRWLMLGGLAAGAAPLFKQAGLAAGAACALHLAYTQIRAARRTDAPQHQYPSWKPWVAGGVAMAVVSGCTAAVLGAQGALGAAWFAIGPFNHAYFAVGDATWLRVDRALRIYGDILPPLAWLLGAAGLGLVWACRRSRSGAEHSSSPSAPLGLFALWFALSLYLACVGPGRRGHHFMPVLPSLGLLALYLPHRIAGDHGLCVTMTARPTWAVVLTLFGFGLAQLAVGQANELSRCWQKKVSWCALSYATPPDYELQGREVRRLTRPDERIYVWGWSPGTYRYAYRLPASRFATLEKLGQVGGWAQFILDGARDDLRARPPRVIVVSSHDLDGLRQVPLGEFEQWLARTYDDAEVVGGMHILMRRDSAASIEIRPDGATAAEPGVQLVPVRDGGLSEPPTEPDFSAAIHRREIDQAG